MLFLDTSALVKRYVAEEGTELVLRRMGEDADWVVSSIARTETEITLCRLGFDLDGGDLAQRLREDWQRYHVVPVDPECLEEAATVGCRYEVRTLDALHLAAADRLPRQELVMLTFDRRQADAARSMALRVEGA